MIDRYHLRYFLAVVETGNFSRAAARVNVTQPTLSTGIAKLERDVGIKLFSRNSRRVSLTEAGARFLAHARTIENEFNLVERKMGGLTPAKLVRLGVLHTVPTRFIEAVIERHRRAEAPEQIELFEGGERDLIARLETGRLDVAITLLHGRADYAQELLFREGYGLAMPIWHRLAREPAVEARDLADEVMIVRRSCEALSRISRHFTDQGVRPQFSLRSLNDDRVLAMVRAGLGITVMPDSYRDPAVARPTLAGFDLQREVGLVYAPQSRALQQDASPLIAAIRGAAGGL